MCEWYVCTYLYDSVCVCVCVRVCVCVCIYGHCIFYSNCTYIHTCTFDFCMRLPANPFSVRYDRDGLVYLLKKEAAKSKAKVPAM